MADDPGGTGPRLPDQDWIVGARRVAVHGLGREGRSVVRHVAATAPDVAVVVLDDRALGDDDREFASALGAEVVVGARASADQVATGGVDLVVRSPGIPPTHPAQLAASAHGTPVTTALNLFFSWRRPGNVIGVTATKGKSTTSALLGHLLAATGSRVQVAGNVGVSVLDLPMPPSTLDHLVLELSSYQLADLRGRLAVGAWLNLHADHHAWHGGAAGYARDKGRIVGLADLLVANAADPAVMGRAVEHDHVVTFDATADPVTMGASTMPVARLRAALGRSPLVGTHNLANLAAAVTIGATVGADVDAMLGATTTFIPLPHRLQVVHDDGRTWVDDSIATIPEAAVAALAAFPDRPVTLLVGGFERGQDHAPLVAALAARADGPAPVQVLALPDTGHRLAHELDERGDGRAIRGNGPAAEAVGLVALRRRVRVVDDLAAAVAGARAVTPAGGVVLLSPAAASFNQFSSFADRGDQFAALAGTPPDPPA